MKQLSIALLALLVSTIVSAQSAKEEIAHNPLLSASNYLAYPGPSQQQLTPAPKGKQPFYLSHYARHGSRYIIGSSDYVKTCRTLEQADSAGKLTTLGKDVLRRVRMLRDEAHLRSGELTQLGAEQHRQIAQRMYERFTPVFEGEANIEANSTVVVRCILSMENELLQLLKNNPGLNIRMDASEHDMYYLNLNDKKLQRQRSAPKAQEAIEHYYEKRRNDHPLMLRLFNDTAYIRRHIDERDLFSKLFKLASNVQSSELRHSITLHDIFTPDELYAAWQCENVSWYTRYAGFTLNGGQQHFSQRNLLRRIIEQADSCLKLDRPGATLRFGHEVCVLPLACLLDLNGYGLATDNLEELEQRGWVNYRIFPMGSNIQIIFYRSSPQDDDILIKVLLNENEATLPLPSEQAPYYRWKDFREHFLKKLDTFREAPNS